MSEKRFKIGDLVSYAPYYDKFDDGWVMRGEMGIVVEVRLAAGTISHQIVKVRWIRGGEEYIDMASDLLEIVKIKPKEKKC